MLFRTKAKVSFYEYKLFKTCNLPELFMKHSRYFFFPIRMENIALLTQILTHSLVQIDSGETIHMVHFLHQQIEF